MSILTKNIHEREDLSDVIDVLKLKDDDMKFLSMINFLPSIKKAFGKGVTAQKHEWIDDAARAEVISIVASGDGADWDTTNDITDLPVVTAEIIKLRVGDVLLGDQDEIFIVKVIDIAAQTIDLYARGHGSTTAVVFAHDSSHDLLIIGNAQEEDNDPLTANHTTPVDGVNYTQIFEDVAEITGTVRRSRIVGGDSLDYQIIKKTKEQMRSLNFAMIEGVKNLDTTNKIGTMGGLREAMTNTSNVAAALTKALLYTAIISHIDAGLFPSAIHGSPTTIGDIEQLYETSVRTDPSTRVLGTSVTTIIIMGYKIELHVDKHVRATEALILDYNRVGYGELDGGVKGMSGAFASYEILNKKNGKQLATQVLGEFTMRHSNGGGTRMYGIS